MKRLPTWREMNMDTSIEVEKMQISLYQSLPDWRKWQLMRDLNRTAIRIQWQGLKERHPEASAEELRYLLAVNKYGKELADRVYKN